MKYEKTAFSAIPGWLQDNHADALTAFGRSAKKIIELMPADRSHADLLQNQIGDALRRLLATAPSDPRQFFESNFTPHRVTETTTPGLVTGYFEPEIRASRQRTDQFPVPLHRRPPDLVTIIPEAQRGAVASSTLTHMRQAGTGLIPMPKRREIDSGALDAHNLDLVYVGDIVDRFIVQVQGSAALRLPDGSLIRVTYDGKNGHPYTSVGRVLIDRGLIAPENMTLETLEHWLKADIGRAREVIWTNESYVFFRELSISDGDAPIGVLGAALTPGRSLAVDPSYHHLGLPIFVSAPDLTNVDLHHTFDRLMIAQDVGSAIKGPERGDLFIGTGVEAGRIAGSIKHPCTFTVLLPRSLAQ